MTLSDSPWSAPGAQKTAVMIGGRIELRRAGGCADLAVLRLFG